jgi:hypothetical protein
LHAKLQALAAHAGWACATVVVHASVHDPQCWGSLVVSAQVDPQSVGALLGQPVTHEYALPVAPQTGKVAGHALPQPPQWLGCVMSVSQPSSARLEQCAQPAAQDDAPKLHSPAASQETAPATCGSTVQS